MSELVEHVTDDALPDRPIETVELQNTRPGNEAALVTFVDGDSVYVKTATDTTERLTREIAATQYAEAHCSVGTPSIVAANSTADLPYLVTEPMPGTVLNDPWMDGADREPLVRQVGRQIAEVHDAEFDQPGIITGGDASGLNLTDTTWTETLCNTIEWRAQDWFADRFSDLPGRLIDTIQAVNPTLDGITPTLIHGDPSRINVYLDPDGLLDWERALVGDPAFGLVEATFHHLGQPDVSEDERSALRSVLYDGYRERAGALPTGLEEKRALYRAMANLLIPQAFNDWASSAESQDELAAEVREDFESRLDQARKVAS
ncbi:phosphotransferase family protein [Halococcus sediminicola]|uniref:phosphotransferase family protein n=1 Tax=Halococcus sediminicola TaxID=1264579 RepID=UPI0009AC8AF2|nr:aminoglycoside phosphotransferase family protein [Halococcus sediminicola]